MNICVIPARGGSKRIPRKNIKPFMGKPVIAYAIEAALESELFDEVLISTDDPEIAQVAQQYGASAPFYRSKELSDDFTATAPVLIHAIEWFEAQGCQVDEMTCIYPANPFLNPTLLKEAYQLWKSAQSEYCFAVSEFISAPQRALKLDTGGRVVSMYPQFQLTRTQDLERAFFDAGMFYFCRAQTYKKGVAMHSEASIPFVLPRHLAHDIDTEEDWSYAETIYKVIQHQLKQLSEE